MKSQKLLLLCLAVTGGVMVAAESVSKQAASVVDNWIFVPIPGALVVLSIISAKRHGISGSHGRAWIAFAVFAVMWFVAEQTWFILEALYHQKPFPSVADFFYFAGYPAYLVFAILYLRPVRAAITRKMVMVSCLIAVAVLVPNLYMTLENSSDETQLAITLGALYPVADAIVLVPSIIGARLFLGGKVNFLWSLMLIGIMINVVADTGFQYFSLDDSYYTGHPVDILFLYSYILFSFGVYDHIRIFKTRQDSWPDKKDLR